MPVARDAAAGGSGVLQFSFYDIIQEFLEERLELSGVWWEGETGEQGGEIGKEDLESWR